jgi:hypothetical protein
VWAGMGAPHEDPWLQRSKRGCGPLAAGEGSEDDEQRISEESPELFADSDSGSTQ